MIGADDAHGSVLVSMIVHSARAADMEMSLCSSIFHSCHRDVRYRVWPMPVFLAARLSNVRSRKATHTMHNLVLNACRDSPMRTAARVACPDFCVRN